MSAVKSFLLFFLSLFLFNTIFAQEDRVRNGGFEGSFDSKGIASGWEDNSSWAPVEVKYSKENGGAGGSAACQKIEVLSFKGGAVQFVHGLAEPVGRFRTATFSLALKGEMKTLVEVQLRKRSHPYTTFITKSFPVESEWKTLTYDEILPDSASDMIVVLRLTGTGTLFVDNVRVTESPLSGQNPFTRLSPPDHPVPGIFFGQHTHNHKYPQITWPAVPFKLLRFWDSRTSWPWLEPKKGEWNWERLDRLVSLCVASNVEILMTLAMTPNWASARPDEKSAYTAQFKETGWAAEAANIEDWKNFVRQVATRNKGRIRYYEMWNEPNNNVLPLAFFTGTHAKLAELCGAAYQVIKEVDPAATVIGPSVVGSAAYMDGFLRAGGKGTFDKMGYHFYTGYHSKSVYDRAPERSIAEVLRLKRVMKDLGLENVGIWNTEAGWYSASASKPETEPTPGKPSEWVPVAEQGDLIARLYLLQWAQGIENFSFYAYDNGNMGMIETDGSLKPNAHAYRSIYQWMVGNKMESCLCDEADNWTATFVKPDGSRFRVVWREKDSAEIDITTWKAKESLDLYGKTTSLQGVKMFTVTGSPKRIQ